MSKKYRLFEICQQLEYYPDYLNIIEKVKGKDMFLNIAYAVHDKDVLENGQPKPSHIHIMIRLDSPYSSKYIAKMFQVPENYVQRSLYGSYCKMIQYLTHKNDKTKHQYNYESEVFKVKGNIDDYYNTDLDVFYDTKKEKDIYEIDRVFLKSFLQQKKEIYELDVKDSKKIKKLKELEEMYKNYMVLKGEEKDLKVVYITGSSGTGKTFLAKHIAKKYNYSYFVSSSGGDPLQGYSSEDVIILDDYRQEQFSFVDFLKLLDNYSNVMVKSRYNNKNISFCKLIIVVSVLPPDNLYNFQELNEELYQLYRRINIFINVVDLEKYLVYSGLDHFGKPLNEGKVLKNPIGEYLKQKNKDKVDCFFDDFYENMQKN